MAEKEKNPEEIVFGLDIGTRSIVGTLGYKKGDVFHVIAQRIKEHETRAMMDGQIHDIIKVGETIRLIKEELEEATELKLKKACIAAAGRVLQTVNVHADMTFQEPRLVKAEDVYALKMDGIEKAYEEFPRDKNGNMTFYCVGNSVIHFYMNGYPILNPEEHKAESIGADIIATFLPDDVIDGLNRAVELADLEVGSMTLEPIAAIQVAIPEKFRMLNLALVDVGAGTSDICITEDGSVVAYGMIPSAGDGLTEVIALACLVDFVTAEQIKRGILENEEVEYKDVMGISKTITREEVLKILQKQIEALAGAAASKIKELNGDKTVSAVFVVGGGGKIPGYTDLLADKLDIVHERVALKGEEVLTDVRFEEDDIQKDSTLVTPIGICLNYYEQRNNFIFVVFNHEKIKLYNNDKLAVVDAALQTDFSNERLFPRRGKDLTFTVNKKNRKVKGQLGEAAIIKINGMDSNIYAPIHENDMISVQESTSGDMATISIEDLPEYRDIISVQVQDKRLEIPKYAKVNGIYQSSSYQIQEKDDIEILDYCSVAQILEYIDVLLPETADIYVNNKIADRASKVYENYLVTWREPGTMSAVSELDQDEMLHKEQAKEKKLQDEGQIDTSSTESLKQQIGMPLQIVVNGENIVLRGKSKYVYVDVFNFIDFDLRHPQGIGVVTKLNGRDAQYMESLQNGDQLEVYWRKE